MENFQYNTELPPIIQKEYGRNIQKLAAHLLTIEDRDKRTKLAHVLIELMREIHPNMREGQDYTMKLWDDLYILTHFDLDVDGPFPPPEKESIGKKPQMVPYTSHEFKYKQYGYQIYQLVAIAAEIANPDDQLKAIAYIGRLMKTFNHTWTEKNIEDDLIIQQIREMSKGRIDVDPQVARAEGLFELEPARRVEARPVRMVNGNTNNPNLRNDNRPDKKEKYGKKKPQQQQQRQRKGGK